MKDKASVSFFLHSYLSRFAIFGNKEFSYTMTYSFVASFLLKYSVSLFFVLLDKRTCFVERCDILVVSKS